MYIHRNIMDSLRYPLKNWVKLIILGVILLIPIVNLIGLGYCLKAIRSTFEGSNLLPGFDNMVELFLNGIKLFIVGLIYAVVPLILFIVASIFGSLFLWLAIISAMAISIVAFMGIANMVYYNNDIGAALKYQEILETISTMGWGKYIIWWIILMFILTITEVVVSIIGGVLLYYVLGFIFLAVGYGYLTLFQARSIALTFASSKNHE
ncbi:MAG: DUF4013 domain-containing protein [Methanobacterium sp. ERen5]|nr:MAG: DUF4013 domain-containing protein [Methanobacterium sp. ERen5]